MIPIKPAAAKPVIPAGMRKFMRTGKKLVVYGEPCTGKTTSVGCLLKAGVKVAYICTDPNTVPLEVLPPEAQQNLTFLPMFEGNPFKPTQIKGLYQMAETGKYSACEQHGIHGCAYCKQNSQPFVEFNLHSLPPDVVVVFDSFSQSHDAAYNHMYATSDVDVDSEIGVKQYGIVSRIESTLTQWLLTSWFNCMVITHAANAKPMLDPKASDSFYPILGSYNTSMKALRNADCVFVQAHNLPVRLTRELGKPWYAGFHGVPADYANMKLCDFVVKYFSK